MSFVNYFCDSCFKFVHEKKNNIGHKNQSIDIFIPFEERCSIHPDIPMNLFCITEKELVCSLCQFLNPHEGHKLILANDLESLKKEGLKIESSTVDFDKNNKVITDLKKQIELELDKINNLYEKQISK